MTFKEYTNKLISVYSEDGESPEVDDGDGSTSLGTLRKGENSHTDEFREEDGPDLLDRLTYDKAAIEEAKLESGTYSYFSLTPDSNQRLHDWCLSREIPNPVFNYHSTVVWTPDVLPTYDPFRSFVSINPSTFRLRFLGTDEDPALVLQYDNSIVREQWHKAKSLGARMTYPDFIPHITLSYKPVIKMDLREMGIPYISIVFSHETVEDLNPSKFRIESLNDHFGTFLNTMER